MISQTRTFLLLVTIGIFSAPTMADTDTRYSLGMTDAERVEFLSEMRMMLNSIQGIMSGIATEDRDLIAKSARYSGNRMARATPQSIRDKLPEGFQQLGAPTHMMFEEIVIRSETDDMQDIAALTATLMNNCLACHNTYRAD